MAIRLAEANRRSFQTLYRYPQLASMRRVAGCTSVSADNPLSPKDPISLNRSSRANNASGDSFRGMALNNSNRDRDHGPWLASSASGGVAITSNASIASAWPGANVLDS